MYANIILKQILCRTEIEGNYVETDSRGIVIFWKGRFDDPVRSIC